MVACMGLAKTNSGSTIGRRRDSRLRIGKGVPARVLTLDGQASASLLDLSQSGAHLRSAAPMRRGQDLMLWWLDFEAFGRLVWISGDEAGIEFDELLPPSVLLETRMKVDESLAPSSEQFAYDRARNWYLAQR
jgi:hypothetical protein